MDSITAMAYFTDELKTDNPDRVLSWFRANKESFDKKELINIIDEFLTGISYYKIFRFLEDVGVELDEKYDELYQEGRD